MITTCNFHELNSSSDLCRTARNIGITLESKKKDDGKKAIIQQEIIKDVIINGISIDDAHEKLESKYKELYFDSEKTRKCFVKEAWSDLYRFFTCFKDEYGNRKIQLCKKADLDINNLTVKNVKPDFYFEIDPPDGEYVDRSFKIIKIITSRPKKKGAEDLTLYALLNYGRSLLKKGETAYISAEIWHLRKTNDTGAMAAKPMHDENFFYGSGNNILCMSETYTEGGGKSGMDIEMADAVEYFKEGIEKDECNNDDCLHCKINKACHFTASPEIIVKEVKNKSINDLKLTKSQTKAIEFEEGIARVLARPGSGKTAVATLRPAVLIMKGYKPESILSLTFSNSAAEEMRTRSQKTIADFGLSDIDTSGMRFMTFHSLGNEILNDNADKFGYTGELHLVEEERPRIILDLLNNSDIKGIDYRNLKAKTINCMGAIAITGRVFDIVKQNGYTPKNVKEVREKLGNQARFVSDETSLEQLIELYDDYDRVLRENNLIEFSDMELKLFELLRQEPLYLEKYGISHIQVDEFQDTSPVQVEVLKALKRCQSFKSLVVYGDDMQSIFKFRDTSPEYIVNFQKYIGDDVTDIPLDENFRSQENIINFGNKLAVKNKKRIARDMIAVRKPGKPVEVQGFLTKDEENAFVVKDIKRQISSGVAPEDISIIAFTKGELEKMADLLAKEKIASMMLFAESFKDNSRVQAAIAMMAVLEEPSDTEDLFVYANAMTFGLLMSSSPEDKEAYLQYAREILESVRKIHNNKGKKAAILKLLKDLDPDGDEVYQAFIEKLEYRSLQGIIDFCNDMEEFDGGGFRRTKNYPGVALVTAHSSKGLEWPICYVMCHKFDKKELYGKKKEENMEETRRLLYVAVTRARDELFITAPYVAFGKKSEYHYNNFLRECYEIIDKPYDISTIIQQRELKKLADKASREEIRTNMLAEAAKRVAAIKASRKKDE